MEFNEGSILVRIWVELIQKKTYNKDQIPNIGNLKEMVLKVSKKKGE